ncbi:MAG: nucleotide exchange factor GrpE, partial [Beijerinckiaceae bacterium]
MMNDETKQPDAETGAPESAPETAAVDPVAALEAEKTDLKDRLLRTLAEMENLRRRTEREVADARTYAVTNFARDMLTVADNIARALQTAPADGDEKTKAFVEGVALTERDLLKTLERHGVKKLEPEGQKFDPHMHQAMFEVPDATKPNGTVTTVVQAGYAIGDR